MKGPFSTNFFFLLFSVVTVLLHGDGRKLNKISNLILPALLSGVVIL